MNNFARKFTSAGMALLLASTGAFASGASAGVLPKNSFDNQVKKKLVHCWNTIPKPIKILGEIGLIGTPFLAAGGVIGVLGAKCIANKNVNVNKGVDKNETVNPTTIKKDETVRLSSEEKVRHAIIHILEKCKEIYDNSTSNSTGLSKLDEFKIFILKFIMINAVEECNLPYKDCIYLTDLMGLSDEQICAELNNTLGDRNDGFSLYQTIGDIYCFTESHCYNGYLATDYLRFIQKNRFKYIDSASNSSKQNIQNVNTLLNKHNKFDIESFMNQLDHIGGIIKDGLKKMDESALASKDMKIIKDLGTGASGIVYLCEDKKSKQFAVKVVSNHTAENENNIYEIVHDIHNSHIIKYEDKFNKDDATYLFMEYMDDSKELAEAEPQNINQVLDWSIQIFTGLKALHDKNIAHRDIKPANILISKDQEIKICDFGLAKHANLTKTICGTEAMMAPEVISVGNNLDYLTNTHTHAYDGKKADVYSAGLVVYCLLTGKELDDLNDIKEKPNNVPNQDRFGEPISENMKKFFEYCLNRDPDSRCTADEALNLLRECQKEQPEKG